MVSIIRPLVSGLTRQNRLGHLLPGEGSIISPTTVGPSLTMGGQWAFYS